MNGLRAYDDTCIITNLPVVSSCDAELTNELFFDENELGYERQVYRLKE